MLLGKKVENKLWTEAINTACYILNRIILQPGETKTSYEKWFGHKPQVKHLKVFGAEAYLNIPKEKRTKLNPKSKKVIVVGYEGESSNYRLWDNEVCKVYISSDVDFNENSCRVQGVNKTSNFSIDIDFKVDEEPLENEDNIAAPENIEREQIYDEAAIEEDDLQGRRLRNRNLIRPPDRFGVPVAFFADVVPTTYNEAVASQSAEKWKLAMNEEIQALEENKTWTLSELPQGKRAIGCKWVYAIKTDPSGNIKRYKARLVAKGFSQREGIDFFETFAPVVRYESIRMLLAIAAERDYEFMKFNVKTAFLYGDLHEDIYLEQPPGYISEDKSNQVYKLHRNLYGLKQSPRCWNVKFVSFLNKFNFVNIESDKCVFVGIVKGFTVYLALYVDDGLITCENKNAIDEVLNFLKNNFKITVDSNDVAALTSPVN